MKLSLIIPAHNEQDNIIEVINKVRQSLDGVDYELVVVDDHSSDDTARLVREAAKRHNNIRLAVNKLPGGFANALRTGFNRVDTELVVPVMGDLCDDLFTIKLMLAKINEGYDVVCGSRYSKGGSRIGGSKIKAFFSSFVGGSLYYLLGLPTYDIANAFKMYKKKVIDSIEIEASSFEISMELALKAHYLGFKIAEVPTVWKERTKGRSSFKMFKLLPNYLRLYVWAIFKRLVS